MMHATQNRGSNLLNSLKWLMPIGLIWCALSVGLVYGQSAKEYIYLNGRVIAVENGYGYSPDVPVPTLDYAVYQGGQVQVRWCLYSYAAAHFLIDRRNGSNTSTTQVAGGEGCHVWNDSNAASGNTYEYHVHAQDAGNHAGAPSNSDIATVMTFSNDPLSAGVDFVRAQHFVEMRQAVSSVRTCAGLGAPTWTDSSLSGVQVKAIHLTEIRDQLNQALNQLQVPVPGYTDPSIVPGSTVIKAAHVQEIREKVR